MSKGLKIRKEMSDGWTIEETYTPKKGLKNKYFYRGKEAPLVSMTDKISQQYAAYTLIEKDLRSVVFWLEEIEKLSPDQIERIKNPDKMNLVKGLFVAALTFYGKCFTSCEGRKVKLERKQLSEDQQVVHDQIMELRHNFAAHSGAENFEDVKVTLALHPKIKSNMKPMLYSELYQPDYIFTDKVDFKKLVLALRESIRNKRTSVGEVVLEKVVAQKPKKYWYKKSKS